MSTPPVIRVVEREARVFSRLWRGARVLDVRRPRCSSSPRWVSGLGGLVERAHRQRSTASPTSSSSRPGLMVASAMQIAANESMWPVLGAVKWVKNFHATVATLDHAG